MAKAFDMFAILVLASTTSASVDTQLDSIAKLYARIETQGGRPTVDGLIHPNDAADPQRTVGFLSQANWHSAKHSLPPTTVVHVGASAEELVRMVQQGELVGAMIKGVPLDADGTLYTFASLTVTPQAVFLQPGAASKDMLDAIDAAIVRMLAAGKAQEARANNPPNNYLEVHVREQCFA
jgi:hypothetical protein